MSIDVQIVDYEVCTAAGGDVRSNWERIVAGGSGIRPSGRFAGAGGGRNVPVATCEGVGYGASSSLARQMLEPMLKPLRGRVPSAALLLLATTVGEVDLLEGGLLSGADDPAAGRLDRLLAWVSAELGLSRSGVVVSCACASSSMAMALGGSLICTGRETDVLVVGVDAVSEFVLAGFTSLQALAPEPARPFDRARQGLSLGEGAGWCWLRGDRSEGHAGAAAKGRLTGWDCRTDGYHMTAPDPTGGGLVAAIGGALRVAGVEADALSAICAHGTGTRYNDEMEVRAFGRMAAGAGGRPFFSIKGAVGHTLGLAGLLEAVVSLEAARAHCAPPSVGCREPDVEGTPVLRECMRLPDAPVLSTNSGFGGVNTALVLEACSVGSGVGRSAAGATSGRRAALAGISWMTDAEMGVLGAGRVRRMPVPSMDNPDVVFAGGYKNWGRVAPLARRLACVLEAGFRELGVGAGTGQASDWGVLGVNALGCHAENVAFFKDYLEHGRELARGALFVQTLPSTPIAEASIHYLLRGPLCHFVDPAMDFSRVVDWGCSMMTSGEIPGIVIAGLEENRVLCAFIRAAGSVAEGADMEWADAMVRRVPCGTPADWLARLCTQG